MTRSNTFSQWVGSVQYRSETLQLSSELGLREDILWGPYDQETWWTFRTSPMFHGSWASWSFIWQVAAIALSRCLENDLSQTTHTELFEWLLGSCKLSNMAAITSRFLQNGTSHGQHIPNYLSGYWDVLVYSQTWLPLLQGFVRQGFPSMGPLINNIWRIG